MLLERARDERAQKGPRYISFDDFFIYNNRVERAKFSL